MKRGKLYLSYDAFRSNTSCEANIENTCLAVAIWNFQRTHEVVQPMIGKEQDYLILKL